MSENEMLKWIDDLTKKIKTAEREWLEIAEQRNIILSIKNKRISELEEELSVLRSACVSAAHSAELACRRLIAYQPVIDAARAAVDGGSLTKLIHEIAVLNESKPS